MSNDRRLLNFTRHEDCDTAVCSDGTVWWRRSWWNNNPKPGEAFRTWGEWSQIDTGPDCPWQHRHSPPVSASLNEAGLVDYPLSSPDLL